MVSVGWVDVVSTGGGGAGGISTGEATGRVDNATDRGITVDDLSGE